MRLLCQNCGYKWDYLGLSVWYATCPRCLRKVKVIKKSVLGVKPLLLKGAQGGKHDEREL